MGVPGAFFTVFSPPHPPILTPASPSRWYLSMTRGRCGATRDVAAPPREAQAPAITRRARIPEHGGKDAARGAAAPRALRTLQAPRARDRGRADAGCRPHGARGGDAGAGCRLPPCGGSGAARAADTAVRGV